MQVGPKEAALRELRATRPIAKHHQIMMEDGCPPKLLREGGSPKIQPTRRADSGVTLAPPLAVQKALAAEFADPVPEIPPQQESEPVATKSKTKTPSKKPAKLKSSVYTNGSGNSTIRPGSKVEIVASLLRRPEGCTTADILSATSWPSVSVPAMAKAAGLALKKEKDGKVTRYRGA